MVIQVLHCPYCQEIDIVKWWWQVENGQFGRQKMNTFATL